MSLGVLVQDLAVDAFHLEPQEFRVLYGDAFFLIHERLVTSQTFTSGSAPLTTLAGRRETLTNARNAALDLATVISGKCNPTGTVGRTPDCQLFIAHESISR